MQTILSNRRLAGIEYIGLIFLVAQLCQGQTEHHQKEIFRIGYTLQTIQDINARDAQAATTVLADAVVRKRNLAPASTTIVYENLIEVEKDLAVGMIDFISMTTQQYIELKPKELLEPAFVAEVNGNIYNSFFLIVRRDSEFKSLADLKNKRLLISSNQLEGLSELWLDTILIQDGLPSTDRFFASTRVFDKSSQALLPVFFRQADVCLVTQLQYEVMVELNPQLGEDLTRLAVSPEFLMVIICIKKNPGQDSFQQMIRDSIWELNFEPNGQQILKIFKVNKLVPFKPDYLRSIQTLLTDYQQLEISSSRSVAKEKKARAKSD